ncbi:MAG: hypothetical protein V1816_16605 [Pseudomonadota bacterium]
MHGLSPRQVLALWNLLFSGAQPAVSKLKPPLTPGERQGLESSGLIVLEKRGRARHVLVTNKAWAFAAEHLDAGFARSEFAADALAGLLESLGRYLETRSLDLVDFFVNLDEPVGARQKILQAYLRASGGRSRVRVRLTRLRALLPELERDKLDQALIGMQRDAAYNLVLWPLDDPRDLRPEDARDAVVVSGQVRHIIYMEDTER